MHKKYLIATTCLLALLGQGYVRVSYAADAAADSLAAIAVRAGEHTTYDRIVFDWPRQTPYVLKKDGDKVRVTFSAVAKPAFDATSVTTLPRAHGFTSAIEDNHLVVTFTVDPAASVHAFTSGNSVAVDVSSAIAGASEKATEVKQADAKAAEIKPAATTSVEAKPAETKPSEAKEAADKKSVEKAAAETKVAPVAVPDKTKTAAAPVAITPPPVPVEKPVEKIAEKPAEKVADKAPEKVPEKAAANPDIAPQPKADARLPVVVKTLPGTAPKATSPAFPDMTDAPLLVLTLDPRVPSRSVIFSRAGYVYIVFDRVITMSVGDLTAGTTSRVTLEPLALAKASGYRFAVPSDIDVHATHNDTAWQIYLNRQSQGVPVSTTLVAQPNFALGARFLLPLPDAPEPVRMSDPVVGDDLILVPLTQNEAFNTARNMADFQIVPAAQGLVIKPLTEKMIVRTVTDGIEITCEGGLHLSSAADTGATQQSTQKAMAAEQGKSIFDFAAWRGKPEETFSQTRQRLQQTIVDVTESERNRARLELARFFFAQGNGEEAMALLQFLGKQLPDLKSHADFQALLGASQILAHRADEGLKTLDSPLLQDQAEVNLWLAVGMAELRNWKEAEERFAITASMLYGYPEPFHSRFTVLAIESALAMDRDHEAADWLAQLETNAHDPIVDPAIHYLHGVLHAKAGRAQAAEAAWKDVLDSRDRLYKVRAEMALIDLGVSTRSLTASQAVDKLEALRFAWRGDDLEVDILHRLAQFYVQAKNVKSGLNIMARAVQLYPTSPFVPQIKAEMSKTFHDVFLTDAGAALSPLDALTLYQQYKNLMPEGKEGNAVMSNLAERLVSVDLLEQSASLLEDLIKNRLDGEEKARTGTRLAAIRLLDHKPDLAIAVLDSTNAASLPPDAQHDRVLLRAKALSALSRDDEALALLHDDNRIVSKILRADITMHAKQWGDAAKALMDLVGPPPAAGAVLSADQSEWLVNAAIALSLAGDTTGLDRLAIDYGAAMAGSTQSDTFRILTSPEKATQLRDITAAQARIADVDMFQGFLNSYRKGDTVPKAAGDKKP